MDNYLKKILVAIIVAMLTSCSSDEVTGDTYEENSYLTGTYRNYSTNNNNKLILNYNGAELANKEVYFYTSNNKMAKMTFANIIEGEAEAIRVYIQ